MWIPALTHCTCWLKPLELKLVHLAAALMSLLKRSLGPDVKLSVIPCCNVAGVVFPVTELGEFPAFQVSKAVQYIF